MADPLVGMKVQGILQVGDLEAMEKELDSVLMRFDYIAEKCNAIDDIEVINRDNGALEVSSVLIRWRVSLLNRKQAIIKEEKEKRNNRSSIMMI